MNKQRRAEIYDLAKRFDSLKDEVQQILEDEQQYFDDMPENFQNGDKGEKAQSAIDALEAAASNIEELMENLNEATA